jgi:hypothetical protein
MQRDKPNKKNLEFLILMLDSDWIFNFKPNTKTHCKLN